MRLPAHGTQARHRGIRGHRADRPGEAADRHAGDTPMRDGSSTSTAIPSPSPTSCRRTRAGWQPPWMECRPRTDRPAAALPYYPTRDNWGPIVVPRTTSDERPDFSWALTGFVPRDIKDAQRLLSYGKQATNDLPILSHPLESDRHACIEPEVGQIRARRSERHSRLTRICPTNPVSGGSCRSSTPLPFWPVRRAGRRSGAAFILATIFCWQASPSPNASACAPRRARYALRRG
jgi:hypothetical protein